MTRSRHYERDGTRTRNPQFRRLIRYPLRHTSLSLLGDFPSNSALASAVCCRNGLFDSIPCFAHINKRMQFAPPRRLCLTFGTRGGRSSTRGCSSSAAMATAMRGAPGSTMDELSFARAFEEHLTRCRVLRAPDYVCDPHLVQGAGLEAVRLIGGGCGFSAAPRGIGQTGNLCSSPAILKIPGRKLQISDELLVIVFC